MRTAIGLIAGPLSPPKPAAIFGLRESTSIASACSVFISETASLPASWAERAIWTISVTFGESFVMSVLPVAFLTCLTTDAVAEAFL